MAHGRSSEVRAGRHVVDEARTYLESRARLVAQPAIVLDIDETSLSNWPAYKINGWGRVVSGECDIERGPCGLRAWQAMATSKALKPTLELDKLAKSLGVAVFFISARPPNLREATEKNLRDQGFEWDEIMRDIPRFAKLIEKGLINAKAMITKKYTLGDAKQAYQDTADRTIIIGVIEFS